MKTLTLDIFYGIHEGGGGFVAVLHTYDVPFLINL
jgi:hypothetical protein